jgi:hypothetical protein
MFIDKLVCIIKYRYHYRYMLRLKMFIDKLVCIIKYRYHYRYMLRLKIKAYSLLFIMFFFFYSFVQGLGLHQNRSMKPRLRFLIGNISSWYWREVVPKQCTTVLLGQIKLRISDVYRDGLVGYSPPPPMFQKT